MSPAVLRIIDANCNRAREALRVLEDYARFALDDDALSLKLKKLRHGFRQAMAPFLHRAILHRDTEYDVGVDNKLPSEGSRTDLRDVVTAAGKRLSEALRVLEEVIKIESRMGALVVEALRYSAYIVEQEIALTLRPDIFGDVRLHVLITESICRRPWLEVAEQALLGGADCLQLREKELDARELLRRAHQLVKLCRSHRRLCIVNDRPDIAVLARADGVHVGQDDLPANAVRKIVGPDLIVGVSTHNLEQARQAVLDGADYIGVGPFFRSETKPRDFLPGPEYARQVAAEISIPAVAIAGICCDNVDQVLATGMRAVAVTSAICAAEDPREAARRLKEKL
jgi:thiamine-phosphate pyrophosphorylase